MNTANAWIIGMVDGCFELDWGDWSERRDYEKSCVPYMLNQVESCASYCNIWKLAFENSLFGAILGRIFIFAG